MMVLSTRNPQLSGCPALTAMNRPSGGSDSPSTFQPQQAMELSTRNPHVWALPMVSVKNSPEGTAFWP